MNMLYKCMHVDGPQRPYIRETMHSVLNLKCLLGIPYPCN